MLLYYFVVYVPPAEWKWYVAVFLDWLNQLLSVFDIADCGPPPVNFPTKAARHDLAGFTYLM